MALHGLAHVTIGVPEIGSVTPFYRDFGLREAEAGVFTTTDGGEQLRFVSRPVRRLVSAVLAADDPDDVARVRAAAAAEGLVTEGDDTVAVSDPIAGTTYTIQVRPRLEQAARPAPPMNGPGSTVRAGERAPGIFEQEITPRKLGHAMLGTTDLDASLRFFTEVLGFRLSDSVPGLIAFLRCSTDHHNIGLMQAPVSFLHHTSWQVDDLDAIGLGAQHLMAVDPTCSVWGLGRHFLGSNLFWYFRDPSGNFAEYYADLDQIVDDDVWVARTWTPDKSLYSWGPPVPEEFLQPRDLDRIAAASV
jgi:catechol 2,3-dioxygenase-like lactoylglutathione lyase family enzyme